MRLIDADAVLRSLSDDLPYKDSVRRVLIQAPTVDAGMELERQRKRLALLLQQLGVSMERRENRPGVLLGTDTARTRWWAWYDCDARCPWCGARMDGDECH